MASGLSWSMRGIARFAASESMLALISLQVYPTSRLTNDSG